MITKRQLLLKRIFDISISIVILPFVIIPLILLIIFATVSTKSFGLFFQQRIGRHGRPFWLFKIRTLRGRNHTDAIAIKSNETLLGTWMRKTKLDELPQLWNVLIGDMSLVGPRPDIAGYADVLEGEDRIVLSVRPGITGPATIKYRNEDDLLLRQENPNLYNDEVIWPDKVKINKEYIRNWSLKKDIYYLFASISN